ncbi:hypothetical protein T05_8209 [Trichinella murrelli]|uniref:Uncharacterized protein n=1 Tax=Trichinella murrelli TaxID=144512 RepID=A0A0V0T0Q4_9BILA|nr:hypothetical protein T05_8332 [Trichinella murrelli]KRX32954.1 hypothetical protein T05_8209 [Trichinella murrelli]
MKCRKVATENAITKKIELKIETAGRLPHGHRIIDKQNKNRPRRIKALAINPSQKERVNVWNRFGESSARPPAVPVVPTTVDKSLKGAAPFSDKGDSGFPSERRGSRSVGEKDRHDENRASTNYGYDGEGADDGRERKPEENLPLMLLRYITLNITVHFDEPL